MTMTARERLAEYATLKAVGYSNSSLTGIVVPLVQAGAECLPFADSSFDVVCSAFGAVPFVADSAAVMREVAAESERLAKGEPALSREAMLDHRTPQDQHIDPGVFAPRGGVARHGERRHGQLVLAVASSGAVASTRCRN